MEDTEGLCALLVCKFGLGGRDFKVQSEKSYQELEKNAALPKGKLCM